MLKKLDPDLFDQYVDYAYTLALDLKHSGYPTYTDGIKTKEHFIERSRKAFSRENEEILLYERNGKISGWIHYYCLPEDHYVDTCSFCIEEGMQEAIREFAAFSEEHFPGSELYLGFPKENTDAADALLSLGFEIIEDDYNDAIDLETYRFRPEPEGIVGITKDNFPLFSALHDQQTDMYWNTERIRNDPKEWQIFVMLRDNIPVGAVYTMLFDDKVMDEIFGMDFKDDVYDSEVYKALLTAVLNAEKRRGVRYITFFNEEESQQDALSCGFRCVSRYVCYKKNL